MSDAKSIWNSNSPNLNLLRRYSLRSTPFTTSSTPLTPNNGQQSTNGLGDGATNSPFFATSSNSQNHVNGIVNHNSSKTSNSLLSKSTCSWEPSADNKYLVGYIVISRQDLDFYQHGFQLRGGKQTHDGQFGAIVEHVVPGSLVNIVCKLKVGDEIVEWNGYDLRHKSNEEVCDIVESSKNANTLRLVAVRRQS